jgi:hypothetical protein
VIGLAEAVDLLQDADVSGNLELLGTLAGDLADRARRLGYAPLARVCQSVAEAARDRKPEEARDELEELTEVSHRVRLGHRGAA